MFPVSTGFVPTSFLGSFILQPPPPQREPGNEVGLLSLLSFRLYRLVFRHFSSQNHAQVSQYLTTLETLLFTSDLDTHILDIFDQFKSLRAWTRTEQPLILSAQTARLHLFLAGRINFEVGCWFLTLKYSVGSFVCLWFVVFHQSRFWRRIICTFAPWNRKSAVSRPTVGQ